MLKRFVRRFESPDEVVELDGLVHELVELGGGALARDTHQPGWRWSSHVRGRVGTEWCESRHLGLILHGRMGFLTRDGLEFEVGGGDVVDVPAGHDAWVIGGEPVIMLTWMGARSWLAPLHTLKERVLVTLVFTDIVDSTGTARRLGDRRWTDLLASHDQRLADAVDRYRGRVVKHTGDGMLVLFDGAARALRCAVACREAAGGLDLRIRAAVHTGEVEMTSGEVQGIAVHEASRILELAGIDQILVSAVTATLVDESGLRLVDRGASELRGTGRSQQLYELAEA